MLNKELKLQLKLLSAITDSIFVHKLDGTFIYVNESAYKTRGYSKEELLSMKVKDLDAHDICFSEELFHENIKNMKKKMTKFGIVTFEVLHKAKDGKIIPVEITSRLIDNDGERYVISIARDISERKTLYKNLEVSEKKCKHLVDNSQVGIFSTTITGEILYANDYLMNLLGYASREVFYKKNALIVYKNPEDFSHFIHELTKNGHIDELEVSLLTTKNEEKTIVLSARVEDEIISGIVLDMTKAKKAIEKIEMLSAAVEQIDDLIMISDKKGIITFVNDAFSVYTGYSYDESVGQKTSLLKSSQHETAFYQNMWKRLLSGETFRGQVVNKKKDGSLFYEEKTITPIKNNDGEITSFVSTAKDITQRIEMQRNLEKLASTDQLTGIYNRHKFEELFEKELERTQRYKNPLSIIMLDIDHFKRVNDTYGHDIGDEVIKDLVKIVNNDIRATDVFSRWGGEEFLILCPETNLQNAKALAEKLRKAIAAFSFEEIGTITSSFGVAQYNEQENRNDFFKRVDNTLYKAKDKGRNMVIADTFE